MSADLYLFIGGSHDGRRIDMPGDRVIQIPEFEPPRQYFSEKIEQYSRRDGRKIETYRLEILRVGPSDVVSFYVHKEIDTEGAILLLVAKYKGRHP